MKHLIKTSTGKSRILVPLELERLNMFPDDYVSELTIKVKEYNFLIQKELF